MNTKSIEIHRVLITKQGDGVKLRLETFFLLKLYDIYKKIYF